MDVAIELTGVSEALQTLANVAKDGPKATQRAMSAIAILVQREARRNAPRSPTRGMLNRARKTKRKVTRSARATSRTAPGALENSIDREATSEAAIIFIASNSNAGKYARRIHEEKGETWRNRGLGTIAKGARADEKFIERAVFDSTGKILDIIKAEHRKAGWYEL